MRDSRSLKECTCNGTSPLWTHPQAACTFPAEPDQSPGHFQTGPFLKSPSKRREIVNTDEGCFIIHYLIHCNILKKSFLLFIRTMRERRDRPVSSCCIWKKMKLRIGYDSDMRNTLSTALPAYAAWSSWWSNSNSYREHLPLTSHCDFFFSKVTLYLIPKVIHVHCRNFGKCRNSEIINKTNFRNLSSITVTQH